MNDFSEANKFLTQKEEPRSRRDTMEGYTSKIRTFDTGATRDKDEHKNDYEGFFSPLVLRRYGDYMQEHRKQKDGSVRASDNWQKGIGLSAFMKSKWRHFMDIWTIFDGYKAIDFDGAEVDLEDALCADLFNTMGYLHEVLKAKLEEKKAGNLGKSARWDRPFTLDPYTGPCEYEPGKE